MKTNSLLLLLCLDRDFVCVCVCLFTGWRQPLRDLLIKLNLIYLGLCVRVCFSSLSVFWLHGVSDFHEAFLVDSFLLFFFVFASLHLIRFDSTLYWELFTHCAENKSKKIERVSCFHFKRIRNALRLNHSCLCHENEKSVHRKRQHLCTATYQRNCVVFLRFSLDEIWCIAIYSLRARPPNYWQKRKTANE